MMEKRPSLSVTAPVRAAGMATLAPGSGCLAGSSTLPVSRPVVPAWLLPATAKTEMRKAPAAKPNRLPVMKNPTPARSSRASSRPSGAGRFGPPRSIVSRDEKENLPEMHHLAVDGRHDIPCRRILLLHSIQVHPGLAGGQLHQCLLLP